MVEELSLETLRNSCAKFKKRLDELRAELKGLLDKLNELPDESHPMDFVNLRQELVNFTFKISPAVSICQQLKLDTEIAVKSAFATAFFKEKEVVEGGKVLSDEKAKFNAQLLTAGFYMIQNKAACLYTDARGLKEDTQSVIELLNQKIPLVKQEMLASTYGQHVKQ